jgi:hypothetical protein
MAPDQRPGDGTDPARRVELLRVLAEAEATLAQLVDEVARRRGGAAPTEATPGDERRSGPAVGSGSMDPESDLTRAATEEAAAILGAAHAEAEAIRELARAIGAGAPVIDLRAAPGRVIDLRPNLPRRAEAR